MTWEIKGMLVWGKGTWVDAVWWYSEGGLDGTLRIGIESRGGSPKYEACNTKRWYRSGTGIYVGLHPKKWNFFLLFFWWLTTTYWSCKGFLVSFLWNIKLFKWWNVVEIAVYFDILVVSNRGGRIDKSGGGYDGEKKKEACSKNDGTKIDK